MEHQDRDGGTALINAASNGHTSIVEALVRAGADIHHRTNNNSIIIEDHNRTALDLARSRGHTDTVAMLEARGGRHTFCCCL